MSIQLRGLAVRIGRTTILERVSFDVPDGAVTGFLGHNGAGKTTTMRAVLGLLPGATGQVRVDGFDAFDERREGRARSGALIEHCSFYPGWNAERNLFALALLQGLPRKAALSEARAHIEAVGLAHAAKRPVRTFSQGMRQRLGIAQALIGGPSNLILDEPTNGLDPEGIADIRRLLARLAKERGLAILLSSHQLHELQGLTDRVVVLKRGKVIAEGETRVLLGDPHGRYAVDGPERTRLFEALSARGLVARVQEDGQGYEVELAGGDPAGLLSGLVRAGIAIDRFGPKRLDLVDFYLHADETGQVLSATELGPTKPPSVRRAASFGTLRTLRFERLRLMGALPWLLLPALAAAISVWAQARGLAKQVGDVEAQAQFSATDVTAFSAVLKALEIGLPLLALFAAGLASQTIAGEFGRGTLRNLVQRGLSRWAIGAGKLLAQWGVVLLGYGLLVAVAIAVSTRYFEFGNLDELLPNGERFPFLKASEVAPEYRRALLAPLLPLLAYSSLGLLVGALLRSGASAIAASIGVVLAVDLGRGLLPKAWQAWSPASYLPTPLGDSSQVHATRLFAEGATNAIFRFGQLGWIAPLSWALAGALIALALLRFRRVP